MDCLVDDDEALTQIFEFFKFAKVDITISQLKSLLAEMLNDGYISINTKWKNENGEYPYSLTDKGKQFWNSIK